MNKPADGYRPNIIQLICPFWVSRESWKAWVLVVFCLSYSFGGAYLAVWSNRLDGSVVDAMVKRQWTQLWPVMLAALGVSLALVIARIFSYVVTEYLNIEWRTWMTGNYLAAWTRHGAYYEIERDGLLTNADQRISQDIQMFVQDTLNLSLGLVTIVVTTVSFTVMLWEMSGTLRLTMFGWHLSVPGYMVYIALLYQIISFLITHYSGRSLIHLLSRKQTVEADFRYLGMQVRENSEQIAFCRGGERERQHLTARFGYILVNWKNIIFGTGRMMLFRDVYGQTSTVVSTLAALPRYLAGAITLGGVTRIAGAFTQLSNALSFFTQAYVTFSEWLALGHRLRDLSYALSRAEKIPRGIELVRHAENRIDIGSMTLKFPSGEVMAKLPSLRIEQGERWLIRGHSGAGKSTLLRAIAGMWPYGEGKVGLPDTASLMFLPQRSYIPYGTLKAALCYPVAIAQFDDEQCLWALKQCRLGIHGKHLNLADRWQQKLSGGEQQRLAIARALLHRPAFVFMDEATSALDPETEEVLYAALVEHLSSSAIISVAHRAVLESFHDHMLDLHGCGEQASVPLPS